MLKYLDLINKILAERKKGTKGFALVVVIVGIVGNLLATDPYVHDLVVKQLVSLMLAHHYIAQIVAVAAFVGALLHDAIDKQEKLNEAQK